MHSRFDYSSSSGVIALAAWSRIKQCLLLLVIHLPTLDWGVVVVVLMAPDWLCCGRREGEQEKEARESNLRVKGIALSRGLCHSGSCCALTVYGNGRSHLLTVHHHRHHHHPLGTLTLIMKESKVIRVKTRMYETIHSVRRIQFEELRPYRVVGNSEQCTTL